MGQVMFRAACLFRRVYCVCVISIKRGNWSVFKLQVKIFYVTFTLTDFTEMCSRLNAKYGFYG
jgi:hypothetical protein